jgi:UDP-2,3-diacylglucosamine pyrophosphatase LpxH
MAKEYYFISDLHIGGDGALDICEFEPELIGFLKELEQKDKETELIIIGDAFGLWELTGADGIDKLRTVISHHRELFEQFKKTGSAIRITIVPGNHDYELACYHEFITLLEEYNITLDPKEHITREVGGRTIWIEHGSQRDSYNAISDFGNPYVTPEGYYITRRVVSTAGKYSRAGRHNWLRDLESVYPNEYIPDWIVSNYFYREMSPLLRWLLVPFLLLFGLTIITYVGMLLERAGIIGTDIFNRNFIMSLGIFGKLFGIVFIVNSLIITFLILLSIPLALIYWDVLKTLNRYGLRATHNFHAQKNQAYLDAARKIMKKNPDVVIFIFGHTHEAFLEKEDGKAIINTGTWLKILNRIPARFRFMPDVYYPSFSLNYFLIHEAAGNVVIHYRYIHKKFKPGLTLLQRFVLFGKRRKDGVHIPPTTVIDVRKRERAFHSPYRSAP